MKPSVASATVLDTRCVKGNRMKRSQRLGLSSALVLLGLAFAATPALAAGPEATIDPAASVEYRSAQASGHVTPEGFPTQWRFEYVTDAKYQENLAHSLPGFAEASVPMAGTTSSEESVGGTIEGLQAGTKYHLRLFAKDVHGSDSALAPDFTTKAATAPVLKQLEASAVEYATATATAKVEIANADTAFTATTCRFEAATQAQWEAEGNSFPEGPFENSSEEPAVVGCHPPGEPFSGIEPAGPGTIQVEGNFSGLHAGTLYHLRLFAQNQAPTPATALATFTTKAVAVPAVTGPNVSSITATSAHVTGTVAPNAPGPVTDAIKAGYNVQWFFTCTPSCSGGGGEVEAGQPATEVSADLGLEPNLQYTVTLHARNAGGEETVQTSFSTLAVAPEVSYSVLSPALNRTTTSLRLIGMVNPHNSQITLCQFEYGTTTAYGQTAPCAADPIGNGFVIVAADVTGLQPGTTYHFRLAAANPVGPATGADRVTETFANPVPQSCGNEAVRAEEHAQQLPDCRAWEMVSPQDKNAGDITAEAANVLAAADGNAAGFASRAGFAETKSTGPVGLTQYVSRRGSEGWTTTPMSPLQNHAVLQTIFTRDEAGAFSEDLEKAVMFAYDLPGAADDRHEKINIYQEATATTALRTVTQSTQFGAAAAGFPDFINLNGAGASADVEVIAFPSRDQYLPNAEPEVENLYEWDHGTLRIAGILPNGQVPAAGSTVPIADPFWNAYRESVSDDGSRIAFLSAVEGQQQLYLRRNHTSTAWVSESEASTPVTAPERVKLEWMSPDGHELLFVTSSKLVDEDTNENLDLYLYTDGANPKTEPSNLELVTTGSEGVAGTGGDVLGASDDAARIYYLGDDCHCGERQMYYWHQGVIKKVTSSLTYDNSNFGSTAYPGSSRVGADGMHMAFLTSSQQTPQNTTGHFQLYVFDAATETLTCASCVSSGPTEADATVIARATSQGLTKEMPQARPRWLSDDGRKAFFATPLALVPEDINGVNDVYVYDTETGARRLVSSGKGDDGAWFENASADGSDAFFVTRQSLVGRDGDELVDLYDARVGGGFLEPPAPPSPCSGDGCRGALSNGPQVSSPATSGFKGPGNPHRAKKKKHRKHKKHRHHAKHSAKGKRGAGK